MFGLEFSSNFPFIKKKKIRYVKFEVGVVKGYEILIKDYRKMLLENQIPINKVRFVFQPTFTYDIDGDVVNPKYTVMLPVDIKTGAFNNNYPTIEIGKPKNIMMISVKSYMYQDNFAFLREKIKKTKRGIVMYRPIDTFDNRMRIADLDEEVSQLMSNIE